MDSLEHWARVAPHRVLRRSACSERCMAERSRYAQMLDRVQRIAAGLLARAISRRERPIAILSGNSIEHLTLGFAAMWAGIPYCPVSPAYSQVSRDLGKLRYVLDLLTPGLVAAFDTPAFARALRSSTCAMSRSSAMRTIAGRTVTTSAGSGSGADARRSTHAHRAHRCRHHRESSCSRQARPVSRRR